MNAFEQFNLPKPLNNAIEDLGFEQPTPMQEKAFSAIRSGKDIVGIAQTGTGKTMAYTLPILYDLKFSKQIPPRVLIMVPTRELVMQVVQMVNDLCKYMNIRVVGIFGGKNINNQKQEVAQGVDVLVATPGRLYDIALSNVLNLKSIKRLVIDEVDAMLDAGFRPQLKNIFDLLPQRRQNIMFSATLSQEVDLLIDEYFIEPQRVSIDISGVPLENIKQLSYPVLNFNTKVNLLTYLLSDKNIYKKVLIFISTKRLAKRLAESLEMGFGNQMSVIHGDKSQNNRISSIQQFESGEHRILLATDVMARGMDFSKITHVINFDTPEYAENYIHRIGRTGRADEKGESILFFTEKEEEFKNAIEAAMNHKIEELDFPEVVDTTRELIPEERPEIDDGPSSKHKVKVVERGAAFHEKSEKNQKTNQGGSYLRKKKQYKKPKTRGDKISNQRKKKR